MNLKNLQLMPSCWMGFRAFYIEKMAVYGGFNDNNFLLRGTIFFKQNRGQKWREKLKMKILLFYFFHLIFHNNTTIIQSSIKALECSTIIN